MEAVKILHISDLHLGAARSIEVWRSLRTYINREIRPHLVLVTGDTVDTPNKNGYDNAKNELEGLQLCEGSARDFLRICPGNHDRHPKGNAPGALRMLLGMFSSRSAEDAMFDKVFGGLVARPECRSEFTLSQGTNEWQVGVVGFDTSEAARYSAQGFAEISKIDQLTSTLENMDDFDIVIVLLHHHLLPIMELEKGRQQLRNLLAPTIMLNSGTMLERLAQGSVNLVLHGHEHHRAVARYGTLAGGRSDVVVLAAGSATGVETLGGAEQLRASLNLVELRGDRTVWVREIRNSASRWEISDSPPIQLIDSVQIDRARFHRRTRSASPPTSRLIKCVEFHPNRDISLTETRTNWAIEEGHWQITTQNSSGWPSPARVVMEWPQGPNDVFESKCVCDRSDDHTYRYEVDLGEMGLVLARRIAVAFQWVGGGTLTQADLQLLEADRRGQFRNEGLEFAAIRVDHDLEALSLLVRVPSEFAPCKESVEVCLLKQGARQRSAILTRALQHHAPGMFSLEVPYPTKGMRYVISWSPPPGVELSKRAGAFYRDARDPARASQLLNPFLQAIERQLRLNERTVALYVPTEEQPDVLRRIAQNVPQGLGHSDPPSQLSLRENKLYRPAWWGEIKLALKDDDDDREYGFVGDEQALAVVPVCPLGRGDVPWGLVRLGMHSGAPVSREELLNLLSSGMFESAVLSVLHAAAAMVKEGAHAAH